jgi:hypothetical protein
MRLRPTDKNITKIKEELIALKSMSDESQKNSIISHSQLNRESQLLADKVKTTNPLIYQHRLINSYVDNYKHKISRKDNLDPLEML